MAGRGRGRGRSRGRPLLVTCRCRSYCTTFNPVTRLYEGGHLQSPSTRDNHIKDDEILRGLSDGLPVVAVSQNTAFDWIQRAIDEVRALSEQPVLNPNRPFSFKSNPHDNGPFIWPNDEAIVLPNHGLYSLTDEQPNRPFLSAVYRLVQIYSLALQHNNNFPDSANSLLEEIFQALGHFTRLKEIEWAQQRGHSGVGVPFVNTGTLFSILFISFLFSFFLPNKKRSTFNHLDHLIRHRKQRLCFRL